MKIEPIGDQILIKRDDEEKVSKSGLVIPDASVQRSRTGVVVETGDGVRVEGAVSSHVLKPGDRVWFNMLSGNEVQVDGQKVLLMAEREVIVVRPEGSGSAWPMDDRVMIRPDAPLKETKGGILLPEVARKNDEMMRGTVVSVGSGKRYWNFEAKDVYRTCSELREGDRVYYARFTGSDVTLDGEEFRVVRESDVLCVEKKDGYGDLPEVR